MQVTEIFSNNISQIVLNGRFDSNTSSIVEKFIREQVEAGKKNFVFNLKEVPFIASAGLRVILVYAKQLRSGKQGDLRIACLQPNVLKVFEISGLNNVLKIYDDIETALQSFK